MVIFYRKMVEEGHLICVDPGLKVRVETRQMFLSNSLFRPIWLALIGLTKGLPNIIPKLAVARESR